MRLTLKALRFVFGKDQAKPAQSKMSTVNGRQVRLTLRQRQIACLVAAEFDSYEIASLTRTTRRNVFEHLRRIKRKLRIGSYLAIDGYRPAEGLTELKRLVSEYPDAFRWGRRRSYRIGGK